jgi:NDP-sugar pyrophosphorylase family protein
MGIANIDVAVLAGGLGTRLQSVLPETPKILAPVCGKPFLEHLLYWLTLQGVRHVVLCLGYRSADVLAFLETRSFAPLHVDTVIESEPLGTGGAVANALTYLSSDPVLVINGDTFVDADLQVFLSAHRLSQAVASILCARVNDAGRYGRLEIDESQRVVRFAEKDPEATTPAWINAGFYLFSRAAMRNIATLKSGSLERDILEKMPAGAIHACLTHGRFLDIGTPESLALAAEVLPS